MNEEDYVTGCGVSIDIVGHCIPNLLVDSLVLVESLLNFYRSVDSRTVTAVVFANEILKLKKD